MIDTGDLTARYRQKLAGYVSYDLYTDRHPTPRGLDRLRDTGDDMERLRVALGISAEEHSRHLGAEYDKQKAGR